MRDRECVHVYVCMYVCMYVCLFKVRRCVRYTVGGNMEQGWKYSDYSEIVSTIEEQSVGTSYLFVASHRIYEKSVYTFSYEKILV